ncbi:helix-turn-helix domain-containing protein [Gluconacetobacter takamatsuzukensis]|uniref:Helix-turn-helix transcriptional regulator n=1 Tax=Gluconacetobacter takamatsuzukensis TaxID=1286190 RepID=A0A7W4KEE6_9PROT|nr:helix-turn-helix transcriptional regulator [Gluconacetobacter takamatsuzukensis]MBB2205444.1 helix-turn-helix transcriptional regulator [Gluconacetobacter takamatsuzukensis]
MKRTADLPPHPPPVVGFADCYVGGFVDRFHAHERGQLSLFLAGSVTVSTQDRRFVLGPGQGMWIPAGMIHEADCRTDLVFQVVYIDPGLTGADLSCRMFDVSSLMRGLVDEIIAMGFDFAMDARMARIARLLVDEIGRAPRIADRLMLPSDPRLRRVCEAITARPGDCRDIDYWAREAGMARRTFTRLFQQEMGLGFAAWRRRVRVIEAASRIAAGQSIAEVAFDLGYDNAGSFSTMFQRTFGVSPRTLRAGSSPALRPYPVLPARQDDDGAEPGGGGER